MMLRTGALSFARALLRELNTIAPAFSCFSGEVAAVP